MFPHEQNLEDSTAGGNGISATQKQIDFIGNIQPPNPSMPNGILGDIFAVLSPPLIKQENSLIGIP